MRLHFYALTMFLGVVLAVHLAMNGAVGAALNNPRVGNALFWCIGAAMALVIGLSGWQTGALAGLREGHLALIVAVVHRLQQAGAGQLGPACVRADVAGASRPVHVGRDRVGGATSPVRHADSAN